ncbi:MAG TPA: hypothetical protein VGE29_19970 [Prosthecobacter sp.]
MDETYTINGYEQKEESTGSRKLTPEQVDRIIAMAGVVERTPYGFIMANISSTNSAVPLVVESLLKYGCDLHDGRQENAGGIRLRRNRKYTSEELTAQEYVEIELNKRLGSACTWEPSDENGLPQLESPVTPISAQYGSMDGAVASSFLLVRGDLKEAIEAGNFAGVQLIEAKVLSKKPQPPKEKAWFIWSSHLLPPINNLCHSDDGNFFKYKETSSYRACYAYTGYLQKSELYYNRADFKSSTFDVGVTLEKFGSRQTFQRRVVYSRKFVTFLQGLGVKIQGYPVHLVDTQSPPWVGPYPEPLDHLNIRPGWLDQYA